MIGGLLSGGQGNRGSGFGGARDGGGLFSFDK
jgi:hypothetical protein